MDRAVKATLAVATVAIFLFAVFLGTILVTKGATDAATERITQEVRDTSDRNNQTGIGNRAVLCNIDKLLWLRVQQNGGHLDTQPSSDPCGIPIVIGTTP